MGWMSWEIFRCNLNTPNDDCTDKTSTACISEALYQGITDGLVSSGLAAAGYGSVHMDGAYLERKTERERNSLYTNNYHTYHTTSTNSSFLLFFS